MLSILKGRRKLIRENAELQKKNEALMAKNIQLRDRLSQIISVRGENDRARER